MAIRTFTESEEAKYKADCNRLGIFYRPRPTMPDPAPAVTLREQLAEQRLQTAIELVCDADGIQQRYAPALFRQAKTLGLRGGQVEKLKVLAQQYLEKNPFVAIPKKPEPVVIPPPLSPLERKHRAEQLAEQQRQRLANVDEARLREFSLRNGGVYLPTADPRMSPNYRPPEPPPPQPAPQISAADKAYLSWRKSAGLGMPSPDAMNDWNRRYGSGR